MCETDMKYSRLSLSRFRLSRITVYLEVKHGNLTTGNIISNFTTFPQYFLHISNFRSQITYLFVKCGCSIYFSSIL